MLTFERSSLRWEASHRPMRCLVEWSKRSGTRLAPWSSTGQVARELGEAHDITKTRRANLLDVAVCTYPFLLPFFIPTILASTTTRSGAEAGMPHVTAFAAGLHNFHSWGLLLVLVVSIVVGKRR